MNGCASNSTSSPSRRASPGRIAYYLENTAAAAEDSEVPRKLEQLRAEIRELEVALDDDAAQERLTTARNLLGRELTNFATQLELEHGENPLRLDVKRAHCRRRYR